MAPKSVSRHAKNYLDSHEKLFDASPEGCAFFLIVWLPLIFGLVFLVEGIRHIDLLIALIGGASISLALCLYTLKTKLILHIHKIDQSWRDEEARQIYREVLAGSTTRMKYYLYLRPFETTGRMNIPFTGPTVTIATERSENMSILRPVVEFESLLRKILESWAPFIGLGAPGEHFGVGRMPIEDSKWRDAIRALCQSADTIFIIPSITLGALWEFYHLFETDYLSRTIIVMPPEALDIDIERLWSDARSALALVGVKLPEYSATGAFIVIANDGLPKRVLRMPKPLDEFVLRRALKELIWEDK